MSEVSIREARNNLSQLVREVQDGNDVTITNHGSPVARLVAAPRSTGRAILRSLDALPTSRDARSDAAIDAAIDDERDAWG